MLPGHADFTLPQPAEPVRVNGRRPIPEVPSMNGNGHHPAAEPAPDAQPDDRIDLWDQRVARGLAFLRRRLTGGYEVDEFGFDRDLTDAVFQPMLRVLYND